MKKILPFVLGLVAALGLTCGLQVAAQVSNGSGNSYIGFNPTTLLNGTPGLPVAEGPVPVLSGGGCGTIGTVQASEVGGTNVVQFASNSTACTITLTLPAVAVTAGGTGAAVPVPNGLFCVAVDETHPADTGSQSAHTTTSCTIAFAATTSADKILVELNGF